MHWATLHGINCIQSSWMESTAFNRDAFYHAAWNVLHSITLHGIHCIQLGSIAQRCMESTAFNQNPLHHTAWNPLHSLAIPITYVSGWVPFGGGRAGQSWGIFRTSMQSCI